MAGRMVLVLLALLVPAGAVLEAAQIHLRGRAPGQRSWKGAPVRDINSRMVDPAKHATRTGRVFDHQYGRNIEIKSLGLRELVGMYHPRLVGMDLAILHFSNGILFPLPLNMLKTNPEPLIATAIRQKGRWTATFPPVRLHQSGSVQKVSFKGNKLVVGRSWLKKYAKATKYGELDPFRRAGSLVGVEFVDSNAWFAQFRVASEKSHFRGRMVYFKRCQFCHSIRGLGATHGPDFDSPRVSRYFTAKKIYTHVRLAGRKGGGMPGQGDFTKAEARDFALWLKGVKKTALTEYRPSYAKFLVPPDGAGP